MRPPEKEQLEIVLKSIYVRFDPLSSDLEEELQMIVKIISIYTRRQLEKKEELK